MGKPSKAVLSFMEQYGVESDEIWEVHGSTWVVKHKALERVAVEVGVVFDRPNVIACDLAQKSMIVCAYGKLGDKSEWSFGEATPANCKNAYFAAMAEKRARDRVILKLLITHGALYSESEADEFTQRPNPHDTRAEDIHDGEIDGDIPPPAATSNPRLNKFDSSIMKVKDARPVYAELVKEMLRYQNADELRDWAAARKDDIHALPGEWPETFRIEYTKHKQSITNGKAA